MGGEKAGRQDAQLSKGTSAIRKLIIHVVMHMTLWKKGVRELMSGSFRLALLRGGDVLVPKWEGFSSVAGGNLGSEFISHLNRVPNTSC